jgi:hypothetical protein
MKKNRRDEPIVVIHIYIYVYIYIYIYKWHKETPCVAIFILNKQKYNISFFSFFFYKIREQEGRKGTAGNGGSVPVAGKGYRRVNAVQILCTHVCKYKNDTC